MVTSSANTAVSVQFSQGMVKLSPAGQTLPSASFQPQNRYPLLGARLGKTTCVPAALPFCTAGADDEVLALSAEAMAKLRSTVAFKVCNVQYEPPIHLSLYESVGCPVDEFALRSLLHDSRASFRLVAVL